MLKHVETNDSEDNRNQPIWINMLEALAWRLNEIQLGKLVLVLGSKLAPKEPIHYGVYELNKKDDFEQTHRISSGKKTSG